MSERFHVEQALFGYHEGHNLVAASVELAPRVSQFLANVTDASGPENVRGFDAVYTGLPVPETNYYAVFCTWPAPEMPRPGCVWSHALLLDLADLARVPDLSILRKLCLRPATPPVLADYQKQLNLSASDSIGFGPEENPAFAAFLLKLLYGQPDQSIVVLDDMSWLWEVPIFSLWSQQWPRMRRSFSFSTGSLADRRLAGVSFDLQVAPRSSQRLWGRSGSPTVVLNYSMTAQRSPEAPWVVAALDDLRLGSNGPLRKFLFSYGSDVETPRRAFAPFVECFLGPPNSEEDDPSSRLAQVARAFPQPTEAISLKRDRLAWLSASTESSGLDPGWGVAYFLLNAREAVAFSRVPFDFSVPARGFWQRKQADVIALLGGLPESERATEFLHAIADVLTPEEIPTLWYEQRSAIPRLLAHKPSLASDAAAWAMPETGQRLLWESLHATTSDQRIWALTCGAMLKAQCAVAERESVTLAGPAITGGLLSWLEGGDVRLPSPAWRDALRIPLSKALRDADLPPPLLALAVWVLSPEQSRSIPGDRHDVQALASRLLATVPDPLILHTLFWLTALGLQTSGKPAFNLIARAFFPVYRAVAQSHYPGESWELLAPILPEAILGLDWDRCRRLRHALGRWLSVNPNLADDMKAAAPTVEDRNLVEKCQNKYKR
jgi:hypothetical protein